MAQKFDQLSKKLEKAFEESLEGTEEQQTPQNPSKQVAGEDCCPDCGGLITIGNWGKFRGKRVCSKCNKLLPKK